MADDDNFDIDIYGDDTYQDSTAQQDTDVPDANATNADASVAKPTNTTVSIRTVGAEPSTTQDNSGDTTNGDVHPGNEVQQIASTGGSAHNQEVHRQAPQQQGTKRKQGDDDDRPTDPGATAALMINDLNWWIGEEDIRGWANQSGCEDELVELTFNEHKVNGKSKGQVYIQLQSPQAATALKHQIEQLFKDQAHAKKPTAIFNLPDNNPFKTSPKEVPPREKKNYNDRAPTSNYHNQNGGNYNRFNNNRGNFNARGGNAGYQNRNFPTPAAGNMGGNMGDYGAQPPMNNFGSGGNMPVGMNSFGGGFNRGGMMGGGMRGGMNNRGGRGGMGMTPMGGMGMPMGGNMMGMGAGMMGMGGNMGMMGGMGMTQGFGGGYQPSFNPTFNQNAGGNDGNWNPHGAKRPRPE